LLKLVIGGLNAGLMPDGRGFGMDDFPVAALSRELRMCECRLADASNGELTAARGFTRFGCGRAVCPNAGRLLPNE